MQLPEITVPYSCTAQLKWLVQEGAELASEADDAFSTLEAALKEHPFFQAALMESTYESTYVTHSQLKVTGDGEEVEGGEGLVVGSGGERVGYSNPQGPLEGQEGPNGESAASRANEGVATDEGTQSSAEGTSRIEGSLLIVGTSLPILPPPSSASSTLTPNLSSSHGPFSGSAFPSSLLPPPISTTDLHPCAPPALDMIQALQIDRQSFVDKISQVISTLDYSLPFFEIHRVSS